jgi:hypothetical protein
MTTGEVKLNHPDSTAVDAGGALAEERERLLRLADNIVAHGSSITYPSRVAAQEVRNTVRELAAALRSPVLPAAGEVREALASIMSCLRTSSDILVDGYVIHVTKKQYENAQAALALPQSKEAGETRDLKEEMMDCYQFGDPASSVPQGRESNIDRAMAAQALSHTVEEIDQACTAPATTGVAPVASMGAVKPTDDELAGWARNWHWNDTAQDRPVDPSIYFRDMRMLKAFITKFSVAAEAPAGALRVNAPTREHIRNIIERFHRNSCYPNAMSYELDVCTDAITAALAASDRE